jgi:hypothetical protein
MLEIAVLHNLATVLPSQTVALNQGKREYEHPPNGKAFSAKFHALSFLNQYLPPDFDERVLQLHELILPQPPKGLHNGPKNERCFLVLPAVEVVQGNWRILLRVRLPIDWLEIPFTLPVKIDHPDGMKTLP